MLNNLLTSILSVVAGGRAEAYFCRFVIFYSFLWCFINNDALCLPSYKSCQKTPHLTQGRISAAKWLVACAVVLSPGLAFALTELQINAILGLLRAFQAPESVVVQVEQALRASPSFSPSVNNTDSTPAQNEKTFSYRTPRILSLRVFDAHTSRDVSVEQPVEVGAQVNIVWDSDITEDEWRQHGGGCSLVSHTPSGREKHIFSSAVGDTRRGSVAYYPLEAGKHKIILTCRTTAKDAPGATAAYDHLIMVRPLASSQQPGGGGATSPRVPRISSFTLLSNAGFYPIDSAQQGGSFILQWDSDITAEEWRRDVGGCMLTARTPSGRDHTVVGPTFSQDTRDGVVVYYSSEAGRYTFTLTCFTSAKGTILGKMQQKSVLVRASSGPMDTVDRWFYNRTPHILDFRILDADTEREVRSWEPVKAGRRLKMVWQSDITPQEIQKAGGGGCGITVDTSPSVLAQQHLVLPNNGISGEYYYTPSQPAARYTFTLSCSTTPVDTPNAATAQRTVQVVSSE
ncbi:MAG: hypothetical protein KatS3mg099_430 [Candidatus Parcubacteria bacterium]|nr:MAG: hypothetical protein KatS3mg099_430 [Candidatus Parcubacteria bacterium]